MAIVFSKRMKNVASSEIREILKVTERPEVISFAGGLPASEFFPIEELKGVSDLILEENGKSALQYCTTEGYTPLREKIASRMNEKFETSVDSENILITSGSQQGLDFTGKLFLDKGDVVLCENPTYLGAISAFKLYEPNFVEVDTHDEGMKIEALENAIKQNPNVKMIYVVPDFQNPTGKTWTYKRRQEFMEVINKYEIPVIEDNPYGELRFEGEIIPALKSIDTKDLVIFTGSFSKILCPGFRIAWMAGNKDIIRKYVLIKQASDLQSSTINQRIIDKYLEMYDIEKNLENIKLVYKKRKDAMVDEMKKEFPRGVKFNCPAGGLFIWAELPENINAAEVLGECLKDNVAFVSGRSFFPNEPKQNTLRLNYSNMPEDRIREGIRRIAKVVRRY